MSDVPQEDIADLPLWRRLGAAPHLYDARHAGSRLADFLAMPGGAELQSLANEPGVRALLLALADHSPFLWQLATANASRLMRCLETSPTGCLETCLAALEETSGQASSEAAIMRALRLAKQETALLVALADLGGVFDVIAATGALSRAADVFISVALRFLLRNAARAAQPSGLRIHCAPAKS